MKRHRRLLPLTIALLLGGCSFLSPFSHEDDQPTVGTLADIDLPEITTTQTMNNRDAAMRNYQAFLDEAADHVFVPEAMRRMADLHLAKEQDALMDGRSPLGGHSRAAELYAELLERFPDHQRNDSALYQLARAHEQSGELEPSMQALTRYTGKYKAADKYDEVQFRRGEYLFVRRDYSQAEKAYQAVIDQGKESSYHQQALYKIGWARFKQNHYESALNAYMR
ncbi:MAG: tetratricopeptide repeat protein, partial [Pseudomonadota bacterium]|nr:tetratricopeptide repeat protein [Pseudomonadota bacterium]